MTYVVTRQLQWSTGATVVEISKGGWDYINPDALVKKYEGEFEEFKDPREALKTAAAVAKHWQRDEPAQKIGIAAGFTAGFTMPFEPKETDELDKWAGEEFLSLPRCAGCGEILEEPDAGFRIEGSDDLFCSEHCAENASSERWCEEE
jgi:hypothetical protein